MMLEPMKGLHRYQLWELLQNVLLTLAAITAIYFIVALAFVMGSEKASGIPFALVLRQTGYQAVANFDLILPLTILTASIFSYGRLRAEREFTAIRVAGVHPFQVLLPAIFVGALGTFGLAWLAGGAMPDAHFRQRTSLQQEVFDHLEDILKKRDRRFRGDGWNAKWDALEQDSEGHIVLRGLRFFIYDDSQGIDEMEARSILADWAKPTLDRRTNRLTMHLRDVRLVMEDGMFSTADRLTLPLNLSVFGKTYKFKRESDMTYEELLTRRERFAAFAGGDAEFTPKEREKHKERVLESSIEFHQRFAFAGSCLMFAVFGAILGLLRGTNNRALVFLQGFIIVILGYYPLAMAGEHIAKTGMMPPYVAVWLGVAVLFILSLFGYRKLFSS